MSKYNYYMSGEYKNYLKKNNLADVSVKDALKVKRDNSGDRHKLKKIVNKVGTIMQQDGIAHALPSFMEKFAQKKGVVRKS